MENKILYTIYICVGYLCLGGHFTLIPNECKKVFGPNATQLYSYLVTTRGFTGVFEILLSLFVMNEENLHDFFYVYSSFCVISLVLLIFVYKGRLYSAPDKFLTEETIPIN